MKNFESNPSQTKGMVSWMSDRPVAANLLMLALIIGGLYMLTNVKQEVFPSFTRDVVQIRVSYPGASPEEVEEGVVLPIEQALNGIDGIDEFNSDAGEGSARVRAELLEGEDLQQLAQDIKSAVDRITTFPDDIEQPRVSIASRRRAVLKVAVFGDLDEWTLRKTAEYIRDSFLESPNVSQAELASPKAYEISINVPQETLRAYNLTLNDIAQKIKFSAKDIPGGSIKTEAGEILMRMKERKDVASQFEMIPIISDSEGTQVHLSDIAVIKDGFGESGRITMYNGKPAHLIEVYRIGDQTPLVVAESIHKKIDELLKTLPEGIEIRVQNDRSKHYEQRAYLLLKNAFIGLLLVMFLLGLFLELRLAFWVMMGIPISFLGCFILFPAVDLSLNMISLFAFIIALGIVVDDAIIVGENIYRHYQEGKNPAQAAIDGALEVSVPVCFSVITNIVAFMPLLFVPGTMGKIFRVVPLVVISVFIISLVESLLILPAHIGHQKSKEPKRIFGWIHHRQQSFSRFFKNMVHKYYAPFLHKVLDNRYICIAIAVAILIATVGYVKSGHTRMILMPKIEADYSYVNAQLPIGSPIEKSEEMANSLIESAQKVGKQVEEEYGRPLVDGIFNIVGKGGTHDVQLWVFLVDPDDRPISTSEFTQLWRDESGKMPGMDSIQFQSDRGGPGSGKGITLELSHQDMTILKSAATELSYILEAYPNTSDIDDGFQPGKKQWNFKLKPSGESLGFTSREVAYQVRAAFYGAEALRLPRGRDEAKVMVRLPIHERISPADINNLILQTPDGGEVPLRDVVEIDEGRAYTAIERQNGRRAIEVTANITPQSEAPLIVKNLKEEVLTDLLGKYPGLTIEFEGRQASMGESVHSLVIGLLAVLVIIYALLAIPFNSYFQPMLVMFSIPFGVIGAVIGHIVLGYNLSLLSLFGIIALTGVVINDSLVLIDFANRKRKEGLSSRESIHFAGVARFRAIILTTLTTFIGLAPMLLESSRQARFLIPMAISLAFGILFATTITLVLIPSMYIVLEDIKSGLKKLKF